MGKAHLARSNRVAASTDERHARRAVVGRTERWASNESVGATCACSRVDAGGLDSQFAVERRKQPGEPSRQHRLACARWPDEQHVVVAGCGDLESESREIGRAHV